MYLWKMKEKVYNFNVELNWDLFNSLIQIDRFDSAWAVVNRKESQILKEFKTQATIESVGASTRIEGSKLTDRDVKRLLENIETAPLTERDEQEVAGYFEALNLIINSFDDIEIMEGFIKKLHDILMKHSQKDKQHRGDYKQHSNVIAATYSDGSQRIIFRTTAPGLPTENAMRSLISWYHQKSKVHPLIKIAAFVYEFLSIHPFQDGNGRLSRLLTTLLLLKSDFKWIQYASFEHEIEKNKRSYYSALRICQIMRPNEDIMSWIDFFMHNLSNVQQKLEANSQPTEMDKILSPKQRKIYNFVSNNPGVRMGEIANALNISKPAMKRLLVGMIDLEILETYGKGAGTNYGVW